MVSLNKVLLIGNVGRDPEMRYTANGTAQTSFSVAVNRNWRDSSGEWKEETEWFNIVTWRELAERLAQSVTKGKQVYVEGRVQTRTWDDDQGVKHYRTEIIAQDIKLLGPHDASSSELAGAAPRAAAASPAGGDIEADDLPFE